MGSQRVIGFLLLWETRQKKMRVFSDGPTRSSSCVHAHSTGLCYSHVTTHTCTTCRSPLHITCTHNALLYCSDNKYYGNIAQIYVHPSIVQWPKQGPSLHFEKDLLPLKEVESCGSWSLLRTSHTNHSPSSPIHQETNGNSRNLFFSWHWARGVFQLAHG